MFIMNDETGEQKVRQGDSYEFIVTGIDADWEVFYSVYNIETQEIMLEVQSEKIEGGDKISVPADESDKLIVPQGKKSMAYGWGIKRKKNGFEDTTIVKDRKEEDVVKIIVLPKITEGGV